MKKKKSKGLVAWSRKNPKAVTGMSYMFIAFLLAWMIAGPLITCYFFFGLLLIIAAYEDYKRSEVHTLILTTLIIMVLLLFVLNGIHYDTFWIIIIWIVIFVLLFAFNKNFINNFGGADIIMLMVIVGSFTAFWQVASFGVSYIFWLFGSRLFQKKENRFFSPHVPTVVLAYFNTIIVIAISLVQKVVH